MSCGAAFHIYKWRGRQVTREKFERLSHLQKKKRHQKRQAHIPSALVKVVQKAIARARCEFFGCDQPAYHFEQETEKGKKISQMMARAAIRAVWGAK